LFRGDQIHEMLLSMYTRTALRNYLGLLIFALCLASPAYAHHAELEIEVPLTAVSWIYLKLGYIHIIPEGLDHILFVVALFLLSAQWKPLLWQISAFTVAHSLTLALAILGIVSLPSSVVEPLIALSIAAVAVENIFTTKLSKWRPLTVFCFGLLHGLGFAGVLAELGLPQGRFVAALAMFNVGVELGQLSVLAVCFALLYFTLQKPWYRKLVTIPLSLAIGAVGLYWTIERSLGGV
jgi:hydrogenase/urease accessory protein HupE